MLTTVKPIAYALFVWWFSTGLIIYLDGLPRRTFRWSILGASLLFAGSLVGLRSSAGETTVAAAYAGFTCGLLAWGWQEITFYMNVVTGPRKQACEEGCSGWRHFGHAVLASLWHELSILGSLAVVVALSWGQPNQVGMWTYVVLMGMHQSAKLNVLLGVPNLSEEFVPEHLAFLRSFLTRKPMNLLFPVSVTVSTVVLVGMVTRAMQAVPGSFEHAAALFIAALMTLALLEHWFLVLPLPVNALWAWSLSSRARLVPMQVDLVAGFLGAGKTTVMRRLLASADARQRTVVLSNDFSSLGIDAALLAGQGAEVVELTNGCVCCSLQKDLAAQLEDLARRLQPARVLIEPSGVADVAALIAALRRPELAALVSGIRVLTVVDAGAFLGDFARMPGYFEAQAQVSPVILVNKTDLVRDGSLDILRHTLASIQPGIRVVAARFGVPLDGGALEDLLGPLPQGKPQTGHALGTGGGAPFAYTPAKQPALSAAPTARPALRLPADELGLESWSSALSGVCDPERLRGLLDMLAAGRYGQLARVKGIVRAGGGWVRFDLSGGRPAIAAYAACVNELPRVMAIGQGVDGPGLFQAFDACTIPGAMQHG